MRAAVYDRGCVEGIKVVTTRALPPNSKSALLVRVKACGVNPVDAKGVIGDKLPPALRSFARRVVDGKGAGFDLSGIVEHAPVDSGFAVGDEVFGAVPPFRGALADLVSVPLDQVCLKPSTLTNEQAAATVLPGVTCLQLLKQHGFREGDNVLVLGASGGVGHMCVQLLRARNAGYVCGVCSEKNEDFVKRLGADCVVAYDGPSGSQSGDAVVEGLKKAVRANNDRPFDLVIDTVTSHDPRDISNQYERRIREAHGVVRRSDKKKNENSQVDPHNYVTIGGSTALWVKAGLKRILGINLFPKGFELFWIKFPGCAVELGELKRMVEEREKAFAPAIAATFPLTNDGVRAAFEKLHARRVVGKVVVVP